MLVQLVCAECGVGFEKYECLLRPDSKHYYCSKKCVGASKRHGSVLFCALCDSEFYRRFGEQDANLQFCSKPCYFAWRVLNRSPDTYPKDGAIHRHRIVAESVLGRKLKPKEVVHHIDLNKGNCKPDNLAVFPNQSYHMRCHHGKMPASELRRFSLVKAN